MSSGDLVYPVKTTSLKRLVQTYESSPHDGAPLVSLLSQKPVFSNYIIEQLFDPVNPTALRKVELLPRATKSSFLLQAHIRVQDLTGDCFLYLDQNQKDLLDILLEMVESKNPSYVF